MSCHWKSKSSGAFNFIEEEEDDDDDERSFRIQYHRRSYCWYSTSVSRYFSKVHKISQSAWSRYYSVFQRHSSL